MKNISNAVIALALVVIAANMTYSNLRAPVNAQIKGERVKAEQKVVRVVGRVSSVFDGFGTEVGFLVKDGDKLEIARYDKGSLADQAGWKPQYINVVTYADGQTVLDPITVEPFN
jgi:hypothetical protein